MPHALHHDDLVARALDALTPEETSRVDEALASDAALRRRFEEIAGHLLQYDHMPPPPPPPPFSRIAEALEREVLDDTAGPDLAVLALQDAPRNPRWRLRVAVAAAAVLFVGVLAWRPWREQAPAGFAMVPGHGITLTRAGRALPAPARAAQPLEAGDELGCTEMAEARLGDRVRLVLDAGSRLRFEAPGAVTLLAGRAWFEVARRREPAGRAASWEVRTAYGPVRVLGTMFEVDLRAGDLQVGVAHGVVEAGGRRIVAGQRLAGGRVAPPSWPAGAWLDRPVVRLAADPHVLGTPLSLRLVFENPGQVPLVLRGTAAARAPLWISLEDAQGRVLHEIRAERVVAGGTILAPGRRTTLAPGTRRIVTIEIAAPFASVGTYFCRALYRPEGQPGVLTEPIPIEVRRP